MPSFGMYTSEGTLVAWLVPDGAEVQMGDTIAEIETEKATNEIPCACVRACCATRRLSARCSRKRA